MQRFAATSLDTGSYGNSEQLLLAEDTGLADAQQQHQETKGIKAANTKTRDNFFAQKAARIYS